MGAARSGVLPELEKRVMRKTFVKTAECFLRFVMLIVPGRALRYYANVTVSEFRVPVRLSDVM